MNITLAKFQLNAIEKLFEGISSDKREIVLKSCTGSGKTIILTHFINEYLKSYSKTVFIWLTPGKGNLEEQSKEKMDRYIHNSATKLLSDVMTSGFEENDTCFINWEKLTKKGNNALKDSERTNFLEYIEKALDSDFSFKIIVDESHQNDTVKADDIIEYFKTDKIIRCSATPKSYKNVFMIDIPEEDVIAEGLIKKVLIINEDFAQNISVEDEVVYLLEKAVEKQREIHSEFLRRKLDINPLIIIQLPNKSDALLERLELYFEKNGNTYENNQLAIWLAERKQNLDGIEEANAAPIAVIIKQAVATGWDCPRAQILVKLRDNMSEIFEIQTIGRIRRMPEAKHYESDLLDSCYLYTLDEKFTEGVKLSLGKGALEGLKLFLKPEYRKFTIISEYKTDVPFPRDAKRVLSVIRKYFEQTYKIDGRTLQNKSRLEAYGYSFNADIVDNTKSGEVITLDKKQFKELNTIYILERLNTHKHGKEYHHCMAEIGLKIHIEYNTINTICRRLFSKDGGYSDKILALEIRELYAFVINNVHKLKEDVAASMAIEMEQLSLKANKITDKPLAFQQQLLFTYNGSAKIQAEMAKSVFKGYISSAEPRSASEKLFEKHCEESNQVRWIYKNGDKGAEYFSIIYEDNFGKQKSFYPDYIVGSNDDKVWVVETKGGFTKAGESEDIDIYTQKKFEVLKHYLIKYKLKGGIVRQDKQSFELYICTETYNEDIISDNWKLLKEVL